MALLFVYVKLGGHLRYNKREIIVPNNNLPTVSLLFKNYISMKNKSQRRL